MRANTNEALQINRTSFKKHLVLVFIIGLLQGFLPYGYLLLMVFLSYYFLKEHEYKYVFLIGYLSSCLMKGWVFTYEQVLLALVYVSLIMLIRLWHHNFIYMYIVGSLLLFLFNGYIGISLEKSLGIILLFNTSNAILFQTNKKEVIGYFSLLIIISYLKLLPITSSSYIMLCSLFIVLSSLYFPTKHVLLLMLFTNFLNGELLLIHSLLVPLLYLMLGLNRHLNIMLYLLTLALIDINFIGHGLLIMSVYYFFPAKACEREIKRDNEYQQNLSLLKRMANLSDNLSHYMPANDVPLIMKDVFDNTIRDLYNQRRVEDYPTLIKQELEGYGYKVIDVFMADDFDMLINIRLLGINKAEINTNIIPIIANVLGQKVYPIDYHNANLLYAYHEVKVGLHKLVSLKYNYFQIPKEQKVCGDMVRFVRYHQNQIFMLSDGMGSGEKAKFESGKAIEFISNLVMVGLPLPRVINIVNDILNLKCEEMFSTLDLLSINVYDGTAQLYKQGSAKTYLVRDNSIYSFESDSMPLGILRDINTSMYTFNVKKNDFFVLVSDGGDIEGLEKQLLSFPKKNLNRNLNQLYDYLKPYKMQDDITLVAILVSDSFTI